MPIVNLTTVSGTDYSQGFIYQSSDGGTPPVITPIDLTGCELRLSVRRLATDVEALVAIGSSDEGGIEITDALNGMFRILITRAILDRIPAGSYVQNLVRKRADDGLIDQIWTGALTHTVGPTHDRVAQ